MTTVSASIPGKVWTCAACNSSRVKVPVLSNTTVSTSLRSSSERPSFTRIPCVADAFRKFRSAIGAVSRMFNPMADPRIVTID